MAETYRVGIIGSTGRGNYGHGMDIAFPGIERTRIVAVADHDDGGRMAAQKRTDAPAAFADYREMLRVAKPDIVAVCPRWVDQHHSMLMACAAADCHVYMEKPFCRDLTESDQVVQAFAMRHLKLGIAHITQYSPVLRTVMTLIRQGVIGDVLELHGRGKEDRRGGGEDLWVLGSHVLTMMRSIAGSDPVSCNAVVTQAGAAVSAQSVVDGAEGIGPLTGDRLQATYHFQNGQVGYFSSVRNRAGSPTRFGLRILGSKGIIELQSGYLRPAFVLEDSSWSPGRSGRTWQQITSAGIGKPEQRTDGTYQGGHVAAIKDLMAAIEEERPTGCSAEDGRAIVEMTAAVFESQRTGQNAAFPLQNRVNPLTLL